MWMFNPKISWFGGNPYSKIYIQLLFMAYGVRVKNGFNGKIPGGRMHDVHA